MGECTDPDRLRQLGVPVPGQRVKPALLIRGFEEACRRFYAVMRSQDADAVFIPLFEALNWASSIDDRFKTSGQRSAARWTGGPKVSRAAMW